MGFEPTTYSLGDLEGHDKDSLNAFREWLFATYSKQHAQNLFNYTVKCQHMLLNSREASAMLTFTPTKRHLAMLALSSWSKWTGCYDRFKELKERLGLKWSADNGSEAFRRLLEESTEIEDIEVWLGQVKMLGWEYYFPTVFMALTGLRPSEACLSLSMLAEKSGEGYYNKELKALEHFRSKVFLRRTKNAYISFVSERVLEEALAYGKSVSWNKMRSRIRRASLEVRFHDLRKAWATKLHESGIPQESVDLLQGRISQNVFARFYYRPSLQALGLKVLEVLKPLENRLLEA